MIIYHLSILTLSLIFICFVGNIHNSLVRPDRMFATRLLDLIFNSALLLFLGVALSSVSTLLISLICFLVLVLVVQKNKKAATEGKIGYIWGRTGTKPSEMIYRQIFTFTIPFYGILALPSLIVILQHHLF